MLNYKIRFGIMATFLLISLCANSQSIRNDLSESDLNLLLPKDEVQRVAYCVGVFDLAEKTADNAAGANAVKRNGDVAFNKVLKSKRLNEQQANSYAEKGFKRAQIIYAKIVGEYDSLNSHIKNMQAREFMKQAVRDCTQITINFKP